MEAISGSLKKKTRHGFGRSFTISPSGFFLFFVYFIVLPFSLLMLSHGIVGLEERWRILYFHCVSSFAQSFIQRWAYRIGGRNTKLRFPLVPCASLVWVLSFTSLLLCVPCASITLSCCISICLLWLLCIHHFHSSWNPLSPFLFLKTSVGPTASMICSH